MSNSILPNILFYQTIFYMNQWKQRLQGHKPLWNKPRPIYQKALFVQPALEIQIYVCA